MLASLIPSLQVQDWIVALNLQYFHITILLAHRKYLRFTIRPNHYQYKVLPFGLSKTPRSFIKYLIVMAAHLRKQGIHIYPYLDNWLIRVRSYQETLISLWQVCPIPVCQVNCEKSCPSIDDRANRSQDCQCDTKGILISGQIQSILSLWVVNHFLMVRGRAESS